MRAGWKAKNLIIKENAEFRLKQIIEGLANEAPDQMNGLLAPEFVSCDEENLKMGIAYKAKRWETNPRNEIHGGAVAAMFDTAMGFSIAAIDGSTGIATAEMQLSYIKPFRGNQFLFETEIMYIGNRNIRVRGIASDRQTGVVLAICTANFARVSNIL